jgi:hypothetical protein
VQKDQSEISEGICEENQNTRDSAGIPHVYKVKGQSANSEQKVVLQSRQELARAELLMKTGVEGPKCDLRGHMCESQKNLDHFSICACHPCAGAMLIFSVSFQFYRMSPKRRIGSCGSVYKVRSTLVVSRGGTKRLRITQRFAPSRCFVLGRGPCFSWPSL